MIACFDCFSGISGDMTLGALIDLGVPHKWLENELNKLELEGFSLIADETFKNGIKACSVKILFDKNEHPRNYSQIKLLIENSAFSNDVKQLSLKIFKKIAEAESKIHGCDLETVHFHEVGGVDSIADIIGTALCIEYLGITEVYSSVIPLGSGFVQCSHGTIPVPAPAVIEILKNVPVKFDDTGVEIVTPTGAAIISSLAESFGQFPEMKIKDIGYGSGTREIPGRPNLLRVIAAESIIEDNDSIWVIETNLDDMNPEIFGYLMDRLFDEGALDVCYIPVFMKKNRPGVILKVLAKKENQTKISDRILLETTSLGIRIYEAHRKILKRENIETETSFGKVSVKKNIGVNGNIYYTPEYDTCKSIALGKNIPLRDVMDQIKKEIN